MPVVAILLAILTGYATLQENIDRVIDAQFQPEKYF